MVLCESWIDFKEHIKVFSLVFLSNLLFPYSSISSNFTSHTEGSSVNHSLSLFKLYRRTESAEKKCIVVSGSILQEYSGFKVSSKLRVNLCSRKWLKLNHNLVSSLIITWPGILKIIFSEGLLKSIMAFLKLRLELYCEF